MRGKRFLTLAILLASVLASSLVLSANHVHDSYDDSIHCALCSFASLSVVLDNRPPEIPAAPAATDASPRPSQRPSALVVRAAQHPRAPPSQLS